MSGDSHKVVASAPGKVTLFGEHAVVYGYPAIVTAIDKRVWVEASRRSDRAVVIAALDLRVPGVIVTYRKDEVIIETDYGRTLSAVAYLRKAVELTSKYLGIRGGVNLTVRSEMPVGAGLGTSAAVTVATIAAYARVMGYELSRGEIAKLGWEVERAVQGIASPMDTSIASFGGTIKIWRESNEFVSRPVGIGLSNCSFIVGYVERECTTAEMVRKVRKLYDTRPDAVRLILRAIGRVTEDAERALKAGDAEGVGTLMNMNHGLLEALQVSNRRLSQMVYAARAAGALGSKLTGAGGGGATLSLARLGDVGRVELALKLTSLMVFEAGVGADGVRVEVRGDGGVSRSSP